MDKISVVINTLNEEKNLPHALSSVKNFADEVVVVDMFSDDKTVDIAKKFEAKVFTHERTNYVEPARNFAISKASGDWILILDADEVIGKELGKRLMKIVKDPEADFYRLPRKNIIFGKWMKYSRWWPDYNIRFFRKGKIKWSDAIHSIPETTGVGMDLPAKEIYAIKHNHYQTISQYILRMNRYTDVQLKFVKKDDFRWEDLIIKPSQEFFSRYFDGKGYKDGLRGLALALLQSFSELVLYLKVWEARKFKDDCTDIKESVRIMKEAERDLHYWEADALLREKGNIVQRLKRKFKLF